MSCYFHAYEIPAIIEANEREANRRFFATKKSRKEHKEFAEQLRNELCLHFPGLKSVPFAEWRDYLVKEEKKRAKDLFL